MKCQCIHLAEWAHIDEVHLLVLALARVQDLIHPHAPLQVVTKVLLQLHYIKIEKYTRSCAQTIRLVGGEPARQQRCL
jgi:hypothetical protein